jgi:hypothetical protein
MRITSLQFFSVLTSTVLYFGAFNLNTLAFSKLEFAPGVNWIFLPAGLRLLCTLLFAEEGAIGILLASFLIVQFSFPNMDGITGTGAAFISAGAPYLTYRLALLYGMPASLQQLTAGRLTILIVIYSSISAFLHQLWFVERGISSDLITGFGAMFTGDLAGSLIVIYAMKMILALLRKKRMPN